MAAAGRGLRTRDGVSDPRIRPARDARARGDLRALVPRQPHRRAADVRSLREYVCLAGGGAGGGAGADRQPARAEPRQNRRTDRAAAAGLSLRMRSANSPPDAARRSVRADGADHSQRRPRDRFRPRPMAPCGQRFDGRVLRSEKAHENSVAAAHARRSHLRVSSRHGPRGELRPCEDVGRCAQVNFWGIARMCRRCSVADDSSFRPPQASRTARSGHGRGASRRGARRRLSISSTKDAPPGAPDNPAALAAAIESLVLSPARAAMLGAAARDEVTRRYSFDRMVRGFEDLYLAQLHTAGVPAGPRVSSQAA